MDEKSSAATDRSVSAGAGPTLGRARIESLDVLRGFALLGILVINVQSFSMPSSAFLIPNSYGDLTGPNFIVWAIGALFFDLKFMTMFSIMFGAGIALMSAHRGAAGKPVIGLHYRRMALLLGFGLIHAYVIWYGDILFPYAVCGMFVVWARGWSARTLVIVGSALFVFGSIFFAFTALGVAMIPEVGEQMAAAYAATPDEVQEEIAAYRGAWIDHLPYRAKEAVGMQFFLLPLCFFWRLSGLMMLGMALYRWGFLSAQRTTRFYVATAMVGAVVGLPIVAWGMYYSWSQDFSIPHQLGAGMVANYFGSLAVAFMWMSLVMLLCKADVLRGVASVLGAYGRMAFTNYIGQSILATWVFYGYGLGLFGALDRVQQVGVVFAIWTVQLILSPIWLRYFRFGPLEWAWRCGVYMKLQPIRK